MEEHGFEFWRLKQESEHLASFQARMTLCQAWVGYNGGRAHLTAVTGCDYLGRPISGFQPQFAVNEVACRRIRDSEVRGASCLPEDGLFFGDAALVTDVRRHWILSCRKAQEGEVEQFSEGLMTPRSLMKTWGGAAPDIFFHEEPTEHDLIFTKVRWS